METSWAISLSLVVACWTLSYIIAIVLSAEEADEARRSSLVLIKDWRCLELG